MIRRVYLSLGSNISPHATIQSCLRVLKDQFGTVQVSPIYQTPSVGFEGDDFLNLVVAIDTERDAMDLYHAMRQIEAQHGRDRNQPKFAARSLDIDILTFGDQCFSTPELSLPRSEILEYAFVLRPLADLAADRIMPGTDKTYGQLWQAMSQEAPEFTEVTLGVDG